MKNKLLILSTLVIGSLSLPVLAQQAPATRSEVKSDIPPNRSKDAAPTLERPAPRGQEKPLASGDNQPKTREEVRQETKHANTTNQLTDKGDTDKPASEHKKHDVKPTKAERQEAREARKPEAREAAKSNDFSGGAYDSSKKK